MATNTVVLHDGGGMDSFGQYSGRWTVTVDPFVLPAGGDGQLTELDFAVAIRSGPFAGQLLAFYIGNDGDTNPPANFTAGFAFDSAAPPAWSGYAGTYLVPSLAQWQSFVNTGRAFDTDTQVFDGGFTHGMDAGFAVTVSQADSAWNWFQQTLPYVATLPIPRPPWGRLTGCYGSLDGSRLHVCDATRLWSVDTSTHAVTLLASGFSAAGKLGMDSDGNLFVPDAVANKVWKVTPSGTVTTYTGPRDHSPSPLGDDNSANPVACDIFAAGGKLQVVGAADPDVGITYFKDVIATSSLSSSWALSPSDAFDATGTDVPNAVDILAYVLSASSIGVTALRNRSTGTVAPGLPSNYVHWYDPPAGAPVDGFDLDARFVNIADMANAVRHAYDDRFYIVGDGADGTLIRKIAPALVPLVARTARASSARLKRIR